MNLDLKNKSLNFWIISVTAVLTVLCITIAALRPKRVPAPGEYEGYCSSSEAKVYARMNVERNLKAPDDADFSNSAKWVVVEEPINTYTVTGEVTAPNAFGVRLRNTFTARLKCEKGEWRYGSVTLE